MENYKLSYSILLNVSHTFTETEIRENTNLLAKAVQDLDHEENNKKVAMTAFKDRIERLAADVKLFANYITNGFTYRDKPCELWLNFETKKRQFFTKESGELVKEEDFHASDYQKKIEFEDRASEIEENNLVGEFAETEFPDAIETLIKDKKKKI